MATRRTVGGSRFLYDSFDLAQLAAQARQEAETRLEVERRAGLEFRLGRIEARSSGWRSGSG